MSYACCWHFFGNPVDYFTHLPGVKPTYEALSWLWEERIARITPSGLYLAPITADEDKMYASYASSLGYQVGAEEEDEEEVSPLGHLVDLNHWGVLQACVLQGNAFLTQDPTRLADPRPPHVGRQHRLMHSHGLAAAMLQDRHRRDYACPARHQLVEAWAEALFDYEYAAHRHEEMGPVQAVMERALKHLEYALYVLFTLRRRGIAPHQSTLKHLRSNSVFEAYKLLQSVVRGLTPEDYAQLSPAEVTGFARSGLLGVISRSQALRSGFTLRNPADMVGRMRVGPHLDWLESVIANRDHPPEVGHPNWQEEHKDTLILRLYQALGRYGPPTYPKEARYHAMAELLVRVGLEGEDAPLHNIAERLRKRIRP